MIPDPNDEIRAIRHKLAAKFDNDVARIGADLRRLERESKMDFVTLPKRDPELTHAVGNQPVR